MYQVIVIPMLLVALIPGTPYGYYILLRWVCCAMFIDLACRCSALTRSESTQTLMVVLALLALVYNPIFKVELNRDIWSIINVISIVVTVLALVTIKSRTQPEDIKRSFSQNGSNKAETEPNQLNKQHLANVNEPDKDTFITEGYKVVLEKSADKQTYTGTLTNLQSGDKIYSKKDYQTLGEAKKAAQNAINYINRNQEIATASTMTDYLHALPSGYRIEEYELVRVLGSGGFGITYLGYDHHLDKAVAIKEYLPNDLAVRTDDQSVLPKSTQDKADYEWGLARFLTEAQTLARFDHRHIIKIHRFFRAHGTGYIVMEYAEGETLSEVLQRKGILTEAELKAILFPILDGLQAVHEADFLHRDIKPGNIVIREDGSPVLIDFGSARQAVARKSRSVTAIVTPGYAPIEQYSVKGHQGPWTDIYGLGAVCYRCLAGEPPDDVTERLREDPLVPISRRYAGKVSAPLLSAIDQALKVDEGERPQSIEEWRKTLVDAGSLAALLQRTQQTITERREVSVGGGESSKRVTRPVIRSAEGSATARTGMSWSNLALVLVIVVLLGASAWQGWRLYRGAPGDSTGETARVEDQQTDTRTSSQTDVWSDTQASSDVEAAPGADRTGTGQPAVEPGVFLPAGEEDEVARLLAAAERDLAARRLTSPVGNNAWEKYQQVLELEPGNQDALTGLQRVIESYRNLFGAALEREEFDKAEGYLAKIGEWRPDSPDMEEAEQRLAAARRKAEEAERQAELERPTPETVQQKALQYAGEMVAIPGGMFRMGDLSGKGRDAEKPVHTVTVPPFQLGKYEVTFALWDACVADGGCNGYSPDDEGWGRGNRPVISVSWNDVQSFIDWMNGRTGGNYRLPSEAEWEYATRAGSTTEYSWGNDRGLNRANCAGWFCGWDSYEHTAPVGAFTANAWGLHDMHGNASEWVQDCWNYSYEGAPGDGSAWGRTVPVIPSWQLRNTGAPDDGSAWESGTCTDLVMRGGSWRGHGDHLRSAYRSSRDRKLRRSDLGFRLAQDK